MFKIASSKRDTADFKKELEPLVIAYGLKFVDRHSQIGKRRETDAEHVYSAIFLARAFIRRHELNLDVIKVIDLLLCHDLHELDCGDTPIIPGSNDHANKDAKELASISVMKSLLPYDQKEWYYQLALEYKSGTSAEAKFARAIDKLDADMQCLSCMKDWEGWTEDFYTKKRDPYYKEVPAIWEFYQKLTRFLRENGYFNVP